MPFTVTVVGDQELRARFDSMPQRVHDRLLGAITSLALKLQNHVVQDKLSGQVLKRRTGKLAGSIHNSVQDAGTSITGRVYSSGINYAAIHEFGGHIPERRPVNAKALHWVSGGKDVFAMYARAFDMPERSYLRSSLADMREEIIAGMTNAVRDAVKQ